jgi:hypothetical protein
MITIKIGFFVIQDLLGYLNFSIEYQPSPPYTGYREEGEVILPLVEKERKMRGRSPLRVNSNDKEPRCFFKNILSHTRFRLIAFLFGPNST